MAESKPKTSGKLESGCIFDKRDHNEAPKPQRALPDIMDQIPAGFGVQHDGAVRRIRPGAYANDRLFGR